MSGWFACSDDGWPLTAEVLTDSGKPWDRLQCLDDLAFHADQRFFAEVPIPSLTALSRRWNRSRDFVKSRLAETDQWADRQHRNPPVTDVQSPGDPPVTDGASPVPERANAENPAGSDVQSPGDRRPIDVQSPGDPPLFRYAGAGSTQHPSPTPTPENDPVTVPATLTPNSDPAPGWAKKARRPPGVTPLALTGAVVQICTAITGRLRTPSGRRDGVSTDAKKNVLPLWRALDRPNLDGFIEDMEILATAVRDCRDPLLARDIRAEGWDDGKDRSRSVATLCTLTKFDERLQVALGHRDGECACTTDNGNNGASMRGHYSGTFDEEAARREFERDVYGDGDGDDEQTQGAAK